MTGRRSHSFIAAAIAVDDASTLIARALRGTLGRAEVAALAERLCALPLEQRLRLPGMHPQRADVLPAGALVLLAALEQLGAAGCRVSDRGLRWGLLTERFGGARA